MTTGYCALSFIIYGAASKADHSQAKAPVIPLLFHFYSCLRELAFVGKLSPIKDRTSWMESPPVHLRQVYKTQKGGRKLLAETRAAFARTASKEYAPKSQLKLWSIQYGSHTQKPRDRVLCAVAGKSSYVCGKWHRHLRCRRCRRTNEARLLSRSQSTATG